MPQCVQVRTDSCFRPVVPAGPSYRNPAAGTTSRFACISKAKGGKPMARKYSTSVGKDVERVMKRKKAGKLKSGKGGRGGTVKSRKQAIAIALSEARAEGKKVPKKTTKRRTT